MPTDAAGFPFWYASKPGGWFYEMEDDPENSRFADWGGGSEFDFNGDGTVTMNPNGPTDFGVGKNVSGFSDSIGGCNMSFSDTAARGYAYKADDARDLEIKTVCTFNNITQGEGFSISARTGHHTGDGCCQGFAYMFNVDPNASPCSFRFRKEMWHVSYHDSPEGRFTHSAANFKLAGHGKVGLGLVIYNKPNTTDTVVLEGWINPNPTTNPTAWTMVKRIEDKPGNGWGDDGGDCDGEDDQVGTWSGAQNRFKTNSDSGSVLFEKLSAREIDPSRALDDTGTPPPDPNDPNPNPPPPTPTPPQGGGTQPFQATPIITYCCISCNEPSSLVDIGFTPAMKLSRQIAGQVVGAMINPDPFSRFGPSGWRRDTTTEFDIQQGPCSGPRSSRTDDNKSYPDGLGVPTFWNNAGNVCAAFGLDNGTAGTDADDVTYHSGRIMKNPNLHLIFWGSKFMNWATRTESPTMNQIITEVRDKLLGTDVKYFNHLQQYGNPGVPHWGSSGSGVQTHTIVAGDEPIHTNTISPELTYCAVTLDTTKATAVSVTNLQWTTMMLSEELIEAQTDPAGNAWYGDTLEDPDEEPIREIGDNPCDLDTGSFKGTYASGLSVMAYWSNSHANCIIPGITATDIGDSTAISFHNGRVLKNPVLRLIFWGTEWTTQTSPTKAEVIAEVQNKLLVTNATFFSGLSQYSGCGTPTYGSAVQNNNVPYPTAGDHSSDRAAIEAVIKNSLTTGLLTITDSRTLSNEIYIVFLAKNKTITTDAGFSVDGYHSTLKVALPI